MAVVRWRAPGRVNLIGEHTDYNDGFVLPFAIAAGCVATVAPAAGEEFRVTSAQRPGDVIRQHGGDLRPGSGPGWAGYVLGVVWAMRQTGREVPPLAIGIDSDVPAGAGLSSSAALVCSVACAVSDACGLDLAADELLAVTRRAENDFVGAPTGGMDQLAALRCTAGHVLFCDMRSMQTEAVPLVLGQLRLLVVDTRAVHQHADGEYRRRREGCEEAARRLGVAALRDVADLDGALAALDDEELRRYVRHVVTENARVLAAVETLRRGDLAGLGPLLDASHASMRDDYRITAPEVDLTVETLLRAGALGARMTGGGFGGCVIALVPAAAVGDAAAAVEEAFAARQYRRPRHFLAQPGPGAHRVGPSLS